MEQYKLRVKNIKYLCGGTATMRYLYVMICSIPYNYWWRNKCGCDC